MERNIYKIGKELFITSDEEIKEGDYYIKLQNRPYINRSGKTKFKGLYDNCQKIILTTDQELIKDGVQAIDDEFLEWFVKNPSCEEVEIVYDYFQINQDNPVTRGSTALVQQYKIIIPTEEPTCWDCKGAISKEGICFCNREGEEPKQEYEYESECICDGECREFVNVKCKKLKQQETIEEIYLNKLIDEANKEWSLDRKLAKEVALKFAKWQQERRYSEKEIGLLNKIFEIYWYENNSQHPDNLEEWELSKKIIEQFKKK